MEEENKSNVSIQIVINKNPSRRFWLFGYKGIGASVLIIYKTIGVTERWRFFAPSLDLVKCRMINKIPKIMADRFGGLPHEEFSKELIESLINY